MQIIFLIVVKRYEVHCNEQLKKKEYLLECYIYIHSGTIWDIIQNGQYRCSTLFANIGITRSKRGT